MKIDNIISKRTRSMKGAVLRGVKTTFDMITSVSSNGRRLNAKTMDGAELRDVRVMTPYGISSSGIDGEMVQIITNDGNSSNAVGVYDANRPEVLPGEIIIYSKFNSLIKLLADGTIILITGSGKTISVDDIYNHINP